MLGFWPHHGRLKLSIWRCETGAKLLEHQLSETSPLQVDVHPETQHVLLLHGVSVARRLHLRHVRGCRAGSRPLIWLVGSAPRSSQPP